MENQFNREEEFIKRLLNETVIEKPSADFKAKIMMRIESKKVSVKEYTPLISETVWWLLTIVLAIAIGGFYFQFSEIDADFSGNFNFSGAGIPEINFPVIEFSRTTQYAVAFLALFFLQIPFLKRFLDRQYEV